MSWIDRWDRTHRFLMERFTFTVDTISIIEVPVQGSSATGIWPMAGQSIGMDVTITAGWYDKHGRRCRFRVSHTRVYREQTQVSDLRIVHQDG